MVWYRTIVKSSAVETAVSDTELGKEVIQPHLPVRLPCYDLTPVTEFTLGASSATSGAPSSHGLTGGVYKARERIHRSVLICDY